MITNKTFETVFKTIAECLGVNVLKKYFPIGGSWWNKSHINKNNQSDLLKVIADSSSCITYSLICLSSGGMYFIVGCLYNRVILKVTQIYFPVYIYIIMVQQYNIILATNQFITNRQVNHQAQLDANNAA